MSDADEIAVVSAVDSNPEYARALGVTLSSALRVLGPGCRPRVYVLTAGLGSDDRRRVDRVVVRARPGTEVTWVDLDGAALAELPSASWLPPISYARMLVPDLLPPKVTRAVWLDADLVVARDLAELFTIDLGGASVAAVRDFGSGRHRDDPERPYYNAGVLVMDLTAWRELALSRKLTEHVNGNELLEFQDQDALNAVIETWLELEHVWNLQLGLLVPDAPPGWMARETLETLRRQVPTGGAVRHYTVVKPWRPSQAAPDSGRWLVAHARSGWEPPVGLTVWTLRWILGRVRLQLGLARRRLASGARSRRRPPGRLP